MPNIRLPSHVAFIMDGNGRWAKKRGLPRIYGHAEGVKSAERIIQTAKELGIKYLTFYAFSTENWKRPEEEVNFLMELLRWYLREKIPSFVEDDIRISFIGRRDRIPQETLKWMERAEKETARCGSLWVFVAVDYGGRDELVRAVNRIISEKKRKVDEKLIRRYLDLPLEVPDPDLLIRTAGEKRVSNFLLWYLSYTEFYFADVLWPDFGKEEFLKALQDFSKRVRKFGGLFPDEEENS
ncbi:MAG TPA: di-trans,poly-cis-decaprenylcistransferase [Aquifex aeolicus]|uniref:Isoprenyl transferase n=1 Tax=Aquifex aeolicus TaxID=63363 RepID=A0A9D0YPI9_AQUAO|nr:di-trans,poly-cis-decaprenylcistransferase [Aquificales bacterium]HIP98219.1 di-trans,poly-cis-decaprenylcistransferase [Aquifex aeolicus]HIQ26638.1 di-trans,poly-cis-decaprenylcistransferase [Aquifex aeolicus]